MAATYYDIADIVTSVLFNEKRKKVTNIDAARLRSYPAANKLVRKSVVREQGGREIRWQLNVQGDSPAQTFGPFGTVVRTAGDALKAATMKMGCFRKDFSFDILEEEFNQGEFSIINHVDNRKQNAMIALTGSIESAFWSHAAFGDNLTPQGVELWFPYCAASVAGTANFVGTYPTNYTDVAGVNPNTYTGWKSYGDQYVAVTYDDLVFRTRLALSEVNFMSPINPMTIDDLNTGNDYNLYAGLDTVMALEDIARLQNEDLGNDLDMMNGRVMIRRNPIVEVPSLRTNARKPLFGINWGLTKNHVLTNWWMKTIKAGMDPRQPTTVSIDIFCFYNTICYDRRQGGFNIATA